MRDDTSAESQPHAASVGSRQMVVGWDLHPNSSAALRFAVVMAQRLDAHLHVVHVVDVDDLPIDPDAWNWEAQLDQRLAEDATTARTLLDQLHAHFDFVNGRRIEESLKNFDKMLAEVMVLAEERLQRPAAQIFRLESHKERVVIDRMSGEFLH